MPQIRDWTTNYTTANGTTLSVGMPNYAANDLLLALISANGARSWSNAGWTQLLTVNNSTTISLAVLYKIAGSSESDPTFTANAAGTSFMVNLASIQDVNTSTPFNGTGGAGTGYITSTATAARGIMPTLTTTVNNSLPIYMVASAAAEVPMILEGPVIYEAGQDGASHSHGYSWGFKPTAGALGTVYYNKLGTAASVLLTLGVSPPAAGATVIPGYCASDSSIYIDPLNGTTAWNNNGATTANVQALWGFFGNSINSKTVAVGSAVAAAADVGINSYHSMAQVTGIATSGSWTGAYYLQNIANRTSLAGKNILVHTKPQTPKVLQNTDNFTRPGVKGLAVGLSSVTATGISGNILGTNMQIGAVTGTLGANVVLQNTLYANTVGVRILSQQAGTTGGVGIYTVDKSFAANTSFTAAIGNAVKIWNTHGSGTVFDSATHVPMIVNSTATSGILANASTFSAANVNAYGFFVSGAVAAPIWQFGSMWGLDTVTIAGGNSANPASLKAIFRGAALGKERWSVLQQGIQQQVIMQPIQFGNGGTDPIYLNLDCTVIEFPKHYDIAAEQVFYNSSDNVVGITYYAGAGDTIIHTNSVISSFSPYFWRFHPSTSASATYAFDGSRVFGAGNIVLNSGVNLNDMTFTNCVEILTAGGTITNSVFAYTKATAGQGAVKVAGSDQTALQTALNKLANCSILYNTIASGGLHLICTGAGGSGITLSTASLSFFGNNFDIYWNAPVNTPLTLQQTGTQANIAKTAAAANSNSVILPPIRTLIIAGIVDGSNVSVYNANTFASPTVPIAGVANVGTTTVNTTVSNLAITADSVNTGRYQAVYSYVYTTATGSASGTTLTVGSLLSGNITIGQTVSGTGISSGTVITALGSGTGGAGTYTLSQSATVSAGTYLTFDTPVNVVVLNLGYQALRPSTSLTYNGTTVTLAQQLDRQFSNPG